MNLRQFARSQRSTASRPFSQRQAAEFLGLVTLGRACSPSAPIRGTGGPPVQLFGLERQASRLSYQCFPEPTHRVDSGVPFVPSHGPNGQASRPSHAPGKRRFPVGTAVTPYPPSPSLRRASQRLGVLVVGFAVTGPSASCAACCPSSFPAYCRISCSWPVAQTETNRACPS